MEEIQEPQATPHKFDRPMKSPPTYRERIELEYGSQFIPYLKSLRKAIGHEKVIESLRELAFHRVKEFAEQVVKAKGKNDLSVFKEIFSPANPSLWDILTMEVVESTDETFEIRVTECLLAEVFRKAGVADYGSTFLCCDVLFTRLVNPQIGLDLGGGDAHGGETLLHVSLLCQAIGVYGMRRCGGGSCSAAQGSSRSLLGQLKQNEGGGMRLDEQDHRSLVLWATDCAEHVLPYFEEKYPEDDRPRKAIEAGRAWVRMASGNSRNDLEFLGESGLIPDSPAGSVVTLAQVRAAAFAAHAAARDAEQGAARAAARAAGHAAATAHVAGHARHAAAYAVTAATDGAVPIDRCQHQGT